MLLSLTLSNLFMRFPQGVPPLAGRFSLLSNLFMRFNSYIYNNSSIQWLSNLFMRFLNAEIQDTFMLTFQSLYEISRLHVTDFTDFMIFPISLWDLCNYCIFKNLPKLSNLFMRFLRVTDEIRNLDQLSNLFMRFGNTGSAPGDLDSFPISLWDFY